MFIVSWFGAMLDGIGFLVGSWVGFSLWRRFSVVAKQLPEKNLCLFRTYIWWSSILRLNSYIYVVWIELLQYWLLPVITFTNTSTWFHGWLGQIFLDWKRYPLFSLLFHEKSCFRLSHSFSPLYVKPRTPNNILLVFHDMILLIMHQRSKDIIFSTYSWLYDSLSILLLDGWSTLYRIINLTGHSKSEMKNYKMVRVVSIVVVEDFLVMKIMERLHFTFGTKILLLHS